MASRLQPGPAFLLRAAVVLLLMPAAIATPADADLWGHITFGRDILRLGSVSVPDVYSFTSDIPWVNHEWLAEIITALAWQSGGSFGLLALKLALVAGVLGIAWWSLRRHGVPAAVTFWLVAAVFVGTYWRLHTMRPQNFSVLAFAALLALLAEARRGSLAWLYPLPLLFACWVNLHGGWIVGAGALALWSVGVTLDRARPSRDRVLVAVMGFLTLMATLVNPDGVGMWQFLLSTVRPDRSDIQDWNSLFSEPWLLGLPWLLTATIAVAATWRARRAVDPASAVIVFGLALASLRTSRLDAFFSLATVLLLGQHLVAMRSARSRTSPERRASSPTGALLVTAVCVGALLVPAVRVARPYIGCLTIDDAWAPDVGAVAFLESRQWQGRMLTWFDWGQYALWHFGPGLQVSMDGRRETVYSEDFRKRHRDFYAGIDVEAFLDAVRPDYVWLPMELPVVQALESSGWLPAFRSDRSLVLLPPGSSSQAPPVVALQSNLRRCFPGL